MNRPLFVILAAVTLDAVGIGLIFPILPRLLAEVTHVADIAPYVGVMLALYAAMQFIFSPVLGLLSDRFGRRPVLLLSLAGAAVDYLLMAFAPELWMLVIGRAIAGLSSANMAVATAYITDITPEEQRARRFGLFHAMFGIGFIVGPVLGGFLGDIWVRAPFIAAAVLNGLNFALALFVLPESRPGDRRAAFDLKSLNPFLPLRWALGLKGLLPLIGLFFIFNFVGQMYGTAWALWGQDAFQWNGLMIGLSLGAFGLFHAGAQAFLPGPITARLGERKAMFLGMACECLSLLAIAFATQGWVVFAVMPLFALGGVGVPALQSLATQQADADRQGQLQGVLASVVSLASIVGPLFFAAVYFWVRGISPGLIWVVGVAVYLLAIPVILRIRTRPPLSATA
ncbi:MAG: Tet(A)/Tet(B)/Tet(C) family tetracycline efflux MFS transporter [Devosia nanyangense]|uniref:Tet(A)/Tet(B)/Tet(C) family tetracycline efflux MFS transporter n=1 Tax=Devosia nanyangense TaxID=1228055 RepID=A0A933L2U2_9HYPH|nr:Tet(A)/Tet(B)/Tet(C) family tetracycline efflux MFS transporter [Devosia nanyangense]